MGHVKTIAKKIETNVQYIASTYRLFGPRMAVTAAFYRLTHKRIQDYYAKIVDASYTQLIQGIPFNAEEIGHLGGENDGPIWVMWWQGIDEYTPPIVRACVDSIRRHANGRSVNIITRDSLDSFVIIDTNIMDNVRRGMISITTLSDIVRFALLYKYGGIWMDATMYLTQDLDSSIAWYRFYSIPNHEVAPVRNWTGYFMGGMKGNPLFSVMYQAFVKLYSRTNHIPDYFMIDIMLSAAYTHIPSVRQMIDAVPQNNIHRFYLANHLNDGDIELPEDTYAYKLTYKNLGKLVIQSGGAYNRILDGRL
ncbi:polysaccharide biosynthesis protein [Bifidobacterium pseudolongum subsp. globosum]|uniref:capsular polysaccharide synthesis protein n=4 Tax=Bifidobacterium pseudolongum TaxID=1694 RepID=UPI0010D1D828|nr:capsular polysaccharide synthesis protein [Bifidobacterium pseudolongum]RYP99115.1 polysaccharide biosynthesis protein [Bifidobacterium pseudolongum subsp. globosum]